MGVVARPALNSMEPPKIQNGTNGLGGTILAKGGVLQEVPSTGRGPQNLPDEYRASTLKVQGQPDPVRPPPRQ